MSASRKAVYTPSRPERQEASGQSKQTERGASKGAPSLTQNRANPRPGASLAATRRSHPKGCAFASGERRSRPRREIVAQRGARHARRSYARGAPTSAGSVHPCGRVTRRIFDAAATDPRSARRHAGEGRDGLLPEAVAGKLASTMRAAAPKSSSSCQGSADRPRGAFARDSRARAPSETTCPARKLQHRGGHEDDTGSVNSTSRPASCPAWT
jgi:hypothetical protein